MNKKHSFIDGLLREDVVEEINNAERIKPIQSTDDKKSEEINKENKKPGFLDSLLGEETVKEMEETERIQLMRANEQAKTEELKKAKSTEPTLLIKINNDHKRVEPIGNEKPENKSDSWRGFVETLKGVFGLLFLLSFFFQLFNAFSVVPALNTDLVGYAVREGASMAVSLVLGVLLIRAGLKKKITQKTKKKRWGDFSWKIGGKELQEQQDKKNPAGITKTQRNIVVGFLFILSISLLYGLVIRPIQGDIPYSDCIKRAEDTYNPIIKLKKNSKNPYAKIKPTIALKNEKERCFSVYKK